MKIKEMFGLHASFFVDDQSPLVPFFPVSNIWQLEKNKVTFIKRRLTIITIA